MEIIKIAVIISNLFLAFLELIFMIKSKRNTAIDLGFLFMIFTHLLSVSIIWWR